MSNKATTEKFVNLCMHLELIGGNDIGQLFVFCELKKSAC